MKHRSIVLLLFMGLLVPALVGAKTVSISYIYQDMIYINAGADDGIVAGDQFPVLRNNQQIATIEAVHVSSSSTSCKIVNASEDIRTDDLVQVKDVDTALPETPDAPADSETSPDIAEPVQSQPRERRPTLRSNRVSGRVLLGYYMFDDRSDTDRDFNQPSLRLNLDVRNIASSHLDFQMRLKTQRNNRSASALSDVPEEETINRFYEFALLYQNPASPVSAGFGRIISRKMSGIGYVDGGYVRYQMNQFGVGIVGGMQPEVRDSDIQTKEPKYGFFVDYEGDRSTTSWYQGAVAYIGRRNDGEISREYFYVRNQYQYNRIISLSQGAEIDLNRGWKKTDTTDQFQVSNFYLNTQYRATDDLRFNLNYRVNQNVRIAETRSVPDSLFNDAMQQGWQLGANWRAAKQVRIYTRVGLRTRENSDDTYSANGGLTLTDLMQAGLTLSARVAYFDNRFSNGYAPSLSLSKSFRSLNLQTEFGMYRYDLDSSDDTTANQYVRLNGYYSFSRSLYGMLQNEYSWGDEVDGLRLTAQIGYRLR